MDTIKLICFASNIIHKIFIHPALPASSHFVYIPILSGNISSLCLSEAGDRDFKHPVLEMFTSIDVSFPNIVMFLVHLV